MLIDQLSSKTSRFDAGGSRGNSFAPPVARRKGVGAGSRCCPFGGQYEAGPTRVGQSRLGEALDESRFERGCPSEQPPPLVSLSRGPPTWGSTGLTVAPLIICSQIQNLVERPSQLFACCRIMSTWTPRQLPRLLRPKQSPPQRTAPSIAAEMQSRPHEMLVPAPRRK